MKEKLSKAQYPASAAAVVFGVYLSARAVFRLEIRQLANNPPLCVFAIDVVGKGEKSEDAENK